MAAHRFEDAREEEMGTSERRVDGSGWIEVVANEGM
jgi:hypothetical protein